MDKAHLASLGVKHTQMDFKEASRFATVIWSDIVKYGKDLERIARKEERNKVNDEIAESKTTGNEKYRLTAEERSQTLSDLLDKKLVTGEISAPELRELKDIFNLKAADQDILIEQMDFSKIDPETAKILEAVNWQIVEYNEKER